MKPLRVATFAAALLVCLAITVWPPLLYGNGQAPSQGTTSLIFLGLYAGIVFGSGILKKKPDSGSNSVPPQPGYRLAQ